MSTHYKAYILYMVTKMYVKSTRLGQLPDQEIYSFHSFMKLCSHLFILIGALNSSQRFEK